MAHPRESSAKNALNPAQQESVRELFNRIAPLYDRFNDQFSLGLHRIWKLMTVKWVDPQPGHCYLDLCCGSGDLAFLLAERTQNQAQIYGVDFAEDLLAIAQQRSLKHFPQPNIQWQIGDAMDLNFPDDYFDGVTVGYGFRNWSNFEQGLRELQRVLKPGGKAALLDFHRPEHPGLKAFQEWFLEHQVVTGVAEFGIGADYAYIQPSLDRFLQRDEQLQLAATVGFAQAVYYPLLGGMMGVLVVQAA